MGFMPPVWQEAQMNGDIAVLKAFGDFLEAAIAANLEYESLPEAEQDAFRKKVFEEFHRLFPDDIWGD